MVIKCKDCMYWKRYTANQRIWFYRPDFIGQCACLKFVYLHQKDHNGESMCNQTPQNGLGYWDAQSQHARFETGEDFGCIHGIQKGKS